MMSVMELAEVLRIYLDESAGCVPPKVYEAVSTAVVLMDAFGKALDAAVSAVVSAGAPIVSEIPAREERCDGR